MRSQVESDWYDPLGNGKYLFNPAKFMLSFCDRYAVSNLNGRVTAWDNGRFYFSDTEFEGLISKMDGGIALAGRKDIISRLRGYFATNAINTHEASPNYIRFKSGVLDINSGISVPFDPNVNPICNQIPWNYNPDAYDESVDNMLDSITCHDKALRNLLEEAVGYCMYRSLCLRKMFVFVGGKRNGKSTFITFLRFVLGKDNVSTLGLQDYEREFIRPMLYGKLANLGDDISNNYIKDTEALKKLVSGEPVEAAMKYGQPFQLFNYATSIFSANEMPKINDPTGAAIDRIIVIPFDAFFSENDADINMLCKITTENGAEYMIKLGIDALKRLIHNACFSQTVQSKDAYVEMAQDNDHVKAWLSTYDPLWQSTDDTYGSYQDYCASENITKMAYSRRGLTRAINSNLHTWVHKYADRLVYEPSATKGHSCAEIRCAMGIGWTGRSANDTLHPAVGKFPVLTPEQIDASERAFKEVTLLNHV